MPLSGDLIVAPATAPGHGALAVVRVSGVGAVHLASTLTGRRDWEARRATRVRLALADDLTDDAIVTTFVAPSSFTGEECVEFSTHGSPVIVEALLRACIERGARLARPGEFTWRAYVNGRIDLLQAEAVADLVAATTAAQVKVATSHLDGVLSARIVSIGDGVAALRARLEASLDFPDEGFHFITPEELAQQLGSLRDACAELLRSADVGQRLREGARVVIAGLPNAGKSSLFNALVGRDRAIVTPFPGTTRDLVAESVTIGGVPVSLVDTAGLRDASDEAERQGVARAEASAASADLVVVVVDPGAADDEQRASRRVWEAYGERGAMCVLTRRDLYDSVPREDWTPVDAVCVSCVTGDGLAELEARMAARLGRSAWDGTVLTRARHRSSIQQCHEALSRAERGVQDGASEEFILLDVEDAVRSLEILRGVETPEDVLTQIFSTFCIGK